MYKQHYFFNKAKKSILSYRLPYIYMVGFYIILSSFSKIKNESYCNYFSKESKKSIYKTDNKDTKQLGDVKSPCACTGDITISSTQTWPSGGVTEMCANARIIVEPGVTFGLNGHTIRLAPGEVGRWKGIELGAGSRLYIRNQSEITGAKVAIQGKHGFKDVWVFDSKLLDNEVAFQAEPSTQTSLFRFCEISNSTSSNSFGTDLIRLNSANLSMTRCTLTNNADYKPIAINSSNNQLSLLTVDIIGFTNAIHKWIGNEKAYLGINNCKILTPWDGQAIVTNDFTVSVKNSLIKGRVYTKGPGSGLWENNGFDGKLVLTESQMESYVFKDNCFYGNTYLELQKDQSLTDVKCNTFYTPTTAILGVGQNGTTTNAKFLSAWGSETQATRNSHVQNPNNGPIMQVIVPINHFYFNNSSGKETFKKAWQLSHVEGAEGQGCGTCRPNNVSGGNVDYQAPIYNDEINNNLWLSFKQQHDQAIIDLNGASPESNPLLKQILESTKVGMGQSVLAALLAGNQEITEASFNIWISRANPILQIRTQIYNYLSINNYSGLQDYLNSLQVPIEQVNDLNIFKNFITWLNNATINQVDIYSLNSTNLDILTGLANSSDGAYTEILRGWLGFNYGIYSIPISYDDTNQQLKQENNSQSAESVQEINILSTEKGCLLVNSDSELNTLIEVYGIDGKIHYQSNVELQKINCIRAELNSGFYFIRFTSKNLSKPIIKPVYIR